jgi:hypothetical protein
MSSCAFELKFERKYEYSGCLPCQIVCLHQVARSRVHGYGESSRQRGKKGDTDLLHVPLFYPTLRLRTTPQKPEIQRDAMYRMKTD